MWLYRGPCEIISASHSAFSLNCSHCRSHACMTLDSSLQELGRRPGCHSGNYNIHIEWKKTHSGRAVSWILSGVLPKNIQETASQIALRRAGRRATSVDTGWVRGSVQWELWGSESSVLAFGAFLCMGRCGNLGSWKELFGANLRGGPVVRTQGFPCHCPSFNSWLGN